LAKLRVRTVRNLDRETEDDRRGQRKIPTGTAIQNVAARVHRKADARSRIRARMKLLYVSPPSIAFVYPDVSMSEVTSAVSCPYPSKPSIQRSAMAVPSIVK
jgi:hypothetical protein